MRQVYETQVRDARRWAGLDVYIHGRETFLHVIQFTMLIFYDVSIDIAEYADGAAMPPPPTSARSKCNLPGWQ